MSEEAGIQIFGPDNVAIRRFRLIVVSFSGLISTILIQETGNFEITFYPDTEIRKVIFIADRATEASRCVMGVQLPTAPPPQYFRKCIMWQIMPLKLPILLLKFSL